MLLLTAPRVYCFLRFPADYSFGFDAAIQYKFGFQSLTFVLSMNDSSCHPRMGKKEGLSNKQKRQVHDVYVRDKIDQQHPVPLCIL